MSSKIVHENPYRVGLYRDMFSYWQKKQVVTRAEFIEHTMKAFGKSESEAVAAVTVMLSPRKVSKIGDCRGNISSNGHLYYAEKLGRQVHAGVKDVQKFRLRWREVALEPRNRTIVAEVKQVKVAAKDTTKVDAKNKETVKVE